MWHYIIAEEEFGPVSEAELKRLAGEGRLQEDSLVWREGMSDWVPFSSVPGLTATIVTAQNPYSYTGESSAEDFSDPTSEGIDEKTVKRIEAIVKDGNQIVGAFIMSLCCSAIGFVIIPLWFGMRIYQWHAIASTYPELATEGSSYGTLAHRFQKAKPKLFIGLACGLLVPLVVMGSFLLFD